jgi:hypothetical protein
MNNHGVNSQPEQNCRKYFFNVFFFMFKTYVFYMIYLKQKKHIKKILKKPQKNI